MSGWVEKYLELYRKINENRTALSHRMEYNIFLKRPNLFMMLLQFINSIDKKFDDIHKVYTTSVKYQCDRNKCKCKEISKGYYNRLDKGIFLTSTSFNEYNPTDHPEYFDGCYIIFKDRTYIYIDNHINNVGPGSFDDIYNTNTIFVYSKNLIHKYITVDEEERFFNKIILDCTLEENYLEHIEISDFAKKYGFKKDEYNNISNGKFCEHMNREIGLYETID